jgi:methylmalonyl-CoA/ethylmalonyl-CoA epimerase
VTDRPQIRAKRIDHVAICVGDVDSALPAFQLVLGACASTRETVASQKTEAVLLEPLGGAQSATESAEGHPTQIELIAPKGNEGLEKFLAKRGPGLHHIAIEVEGIEDALAQLQAAGVPLIDTAPRMGARGHKVAFLHPKAAGGVLIELVEPHGDGGSAGP